MPPKGSEDRAPRRGTTTALQQRSEQDIISPARFSAAARRYAPYGAFYLPALRATLFEKRASEESFRDTGESRLFQEG